MTEDLSIKLERIWSQRQIPVILRKGGNNPILIGLPYAGNNRAWLKLNHRINPKWEPSSKAWSIPKSWFNDLVSKCLERYNKVYVIQPYREQEKCAPACWNAKGHECQCSCMGKNHGSRGPNSDWLVISDTFATRYKKVQFAVRLITKSGT